MRTKTVIFGYTTPPFIHDGRTLVFWPNAVLPMIGIRETSTRPAKHWHLEFLQCRDYIIAYSFGIGNGLILLAYIKAIIDTSAEMFSKMAINITIDFGSATSLNAG